MDGDAEAYAADEFTARVDCTVGGISLAGFPRDVTVIPGTPTVVATLVGAHCYTVETETGSATAVTYQPATDGAESGPVEITADGPAMITIINTYRAGALRIVKVLAGPGARVGTGPFTFDVACSFNGDAAAYTGTVTMDRDGNATVLTSDPITGLPVGAVCTVTETGAGSADAVAEPVTVTIPDVDDQGTARTVDAAFVNAFSGARLLVTKVLTGDRADEMADAVFTVAVTCQLPEGDQRLTVYAGSLPIRGGQTVAVPDGNGDPAVLPAGARCFADETDDGGADASTVDHDSFDNAVLVGISDQLQRLTITVTNEFDALPATTRPSTGSASTPPTAKPTGASEQSPTTSTYRPTSSSAGAGGGLSNTGVATLTMLAVALALLAGGGALTLITRRRGRGGHQ